MEAHNLWRELRDDVDVSVSLPGDTHVWLTVTVVGRWPQAALALPLTLLAARKFRERLTVVVVSFGRDSSDLQRVAALCKPALDEGWLAFASGGEAAHTASQEGWAERPVLVPDADGELLDLDDNQRLEFWHASVCKNSAAMAAAALARGVSGSHVLVNLDCDNIPTDRYIAEVFKRFANAQPGMYPFAWTSGDIASACTGRMAYFMKDFIELGGYDEEGTAPSGYQDIDLKQRFLQKRNTLQGQGSRNAGGAFCGSHLVGGALPNSAESRKADRGPAKVANVAPEWRAKTWGQMNSHNVELMNGRTRAGQLTRNVGRRPLGAWWQFLDPLLAPALCRPSRAQASSASTAAGPGPQALAVAPQAVPCAAAGAAVPFHDDDAAGRRSAFEGAMRCAEAHAAGPGKLTPSRLTADLERAQRALRSQLPPRVAPAALVSRPPVPTVRLLACGLKVLADVQRTEATCLA